MKEAAAAAREKHGEASMSKTTLLTQMPYTQQHTLKKKRNTKKPRRKWHGSSSSTGKA
jgi:hypothetical protein